jgi:hypothetical protein
MTTTSERDRHRCREVGRSYRQTSGFGETEARPGAGRSGSHDPKRRGGGMAGARAESRALRRYAEADEIETARTILYDYIGEGSVVEEGEGVFGYVRLSAAAGCKSGAQERT